VDALRFIHPTSVERLRTVPYTPRFTLHEILAP